MGSVTSKCYAKSHESSSTNKQLGERILAQEEVIKELKRVREHEAWVYEQQLAVFASKEKEWKQEMKKHKEEEAKLRKVLQEPNSRRPCLEEEEEEWRRLGAGYLVECMKEEQARREEAVEKWKQLYLTIKTELDGLIQRTREGERFGWGTEESTIEGLQKDLRDREESMETMRSHIAMMQKEVHKKDREIDILRQSLRILSNKRRGLITNTALRS